MTGVLRATREYPTVDGIRTVDEVVFVCPTCGDSAAFALNRDALPTTVDCPNVECQAVLTGLDYE